MLKGPYACIGFFMLKSETTKNCVALFLFLKSMENSFPLTYSEKLSVSMFPRTPRNLFPDSST